MEAEQTALHSFVRLHGTRLKGVRTHNRVAHLVPFSPSGILLHAPLQPYTVERIVAELDAESLPIRWLIQQVQTYDVDTQNVLGLVFDRQSALAHVVQCGAPKSSIEEND